MIKFRLYIPPVILGFVIVPLLVWPTVIARKAIENPLNQPEQGTQYQIWEDDWMIDECLCAMYDASSE